MIRGLAAFMLVLGWAVAAVAGPVTLTISPALEPAGSDWHEVVRLRDASRTAIGQSCGEPML